MRQTCAAAGFTLIEVMVSLLIISLLATGAIMLRSKYLDEQYVARQRFVATALAWNPLLEQYRSNHGWQPANSDRETKARVSQWGQDWHWELTSTPTLGEQFFRYEVTVRPALAAAGDAPQSLAGILVAYWVQE